MAKPEPIGHTRWAIAEGYIPAWSHGPEPEFTSHETACILNTTDRDAHVEITIYYSDREPVGPYQIVVPARHRLRERDRLRCPDRGAAHAARLATSRKRVDHHDCLSRAMKECNWLKPRAIFWSSVSPSGA